MGKMVSTVFGGARQPEGGARTQPNGAAAMGQEHGLVAGKKFTVGHLAVPFYRTRIPILCGGRTLYCRRIEFQLGSWIRLNLEIIFSLAMVEQGIRSRLDHLLT
jgi:hypothetical protein